MGDRRDGRRKRDWDAWIARDRAALSSSGLPSGQLQQIMQK